MGRARVQRWGLWLLAWFAGGLSAAEPDWRLRLDLGSVWQTRNEVAIPGDTGTRFSVKQVTGAGPFPFARFEAAYRPAERHAVRLLVAPLTIQRSGRLNRDVFFVDRTFTAGDVEATYRFDSYRLTYRYRVYAAERSALWLGFTGKIRDAEVALRQSGAVARDTNVGFVPLLHAYWTYRLGPRSRLVGDVDALGAPQGRAIDAGLRLDYALSPRWSAGLGYRTLEGGADNDSVYSFAWLHYAVVAVGYRF